jgi:hypothetical protein
MSKKDVQEISRLRNENARLRDELRGLEEDARVFMNLLKAADQFGPTHKITTDMLSNILDMAKA